MVHVDRLKLGLSYDEKMKFISEDMCKGATEKVPKHKLIGFLLLTIGNAVGFGNVWRFPKLVQANGGLSFVIIYCICACVFAYPAVLIEFLLGQLCQGTPWEAGYACKLKPALNIGASIWSVCGYCSFYGTLVAYSLRYLFKSFGQPWYPKAEWFTYCENQTVSACESLPIYDTHAVCTVAHNACTVDIVGYSNWYFYNVQKTTGDMDGSVKSINWGLWGCYVVMLCTILFSLVFGKEILEKYVLTVIMPLPGFVLIGLLIYAFTLPGAGDGMKAYIGNFDSAAFYDTRVWTLAINQVVFSVSIGAFKMVALAADRRMDQTAGTDAIIVVVTDTLFAIFAGMIIYCFMGYLAQLTGITVEEAAGSGGQSLLFCVFSAATSALTNAGIGSGFINMFWWFLVFVLGWSTLLVDVEVVADAYAHSVLSIKLWGEKLSVKWVKSVYVVVICVIMALLGLTAASDQGGHLLDVVDHYVGDMLLPWNATALAILFGHCIAWKWTVDRVGVLAAASTIITVMGCSVLAGLSQYFTDNTEHNAIIFLCLAILVPLAAVFPITGIACANNKKGYAENLDLIWKGYIGCVVLENADKLINYHRPRLGRGCCWPVVGGFYRWMVCPFLFSLILNSYFSGDSYAFKNGDGVQYPFWCIACAFTLWAVQWIHTILICIFPDFFHPFLRPTAIEGFLENHEEPLFGLEQYIIKGMADRAAAGSEEGRSTAEVAEDSVSEESDSTSSKEEAEVKRASHDLPT